MGRKTSTCGNGRDRCGAWRTYLCPMSPFMNGERERQKTQSEARVFLLHALIAYSHIKITTDHGEAARVVVPMGRLPLACRALPAMARVLVTRVFTEAVCILEKDVAQGALARPETHRTRVLVLAASVLCRQHLGAMTAA